MFVFRCYPRTEARALLGDVQPLPWNVELLRSEVLLSTKRCNHPSDSSPNKLELRARLNLERLNDLSGMMRTINGKPTLRVGFVPVCCGTLENKCWSNCAEWLTVTIVITSNATLRSTSHFQEQHSFHTITIRQT